MTMEKYFCGFIGKNHRNCTICNTYYREILNEDFIKEEYVNKQKSIVDISKEFLIPYRRIEIFIKENTKFHRKLKDSVNTEVKKEKSKTTCLLKYGDVNVLGKKSPIYKKRNLSVKEKYGVDNVFQLEDVKEKLNKTMLKKFGQLRISNGEKISNFRRNLNEKERTIYYNKISKTHKNNWECIYTEEKKEELMENLIKARIKKVFLLKENKIFESSIEKKIAESLVFLDVPFIYNFFIGKHSYDFRILKTKFIIEIQGDYWHATPKKYLSKDIILKRNGYEVLAKDIWEKDRNKKIYAEKYGYKILYIWESEIIYKNKEELNKLLIQLLNLEKINEDSEHKKNYKQVKKIRHTNKNSKLFC